MYHSILILALSFLASLTCAAVPDGNFEKPTLRPYWHIGRYYGPLGKRVVDPLDPTNHVLRFNINNCNGEVYAVAAGRANSIKSNTAYDVSFRYLFPAATSGVGWSVNFYAASNCNPCTVSFPKHDKYEDNPEANVWYTYQATLNITGKPGKQVDGAGGVTRLEIYPTACYYPEDGDIYMDDVKVVRSK